MKMHHKLQCELCIPRCKDRAGAWQVWVRRGKAGDTREGVERHCRPLGPGHPPRGWQMASLAHAQLSPAWEVAWAWEGGDWPHSPMEPRTGVAVVASCCQLVSELSCQGF